MKRFRKNKFLAILLAILLILQLAPTAALAEFGSETPDNRDAAVVLQSDDPTADDPADGDRPPSDSTDETGSDPAPSDNPDPVDEADPIDEGDPADTSDPAEETSPEGEPTGADDPAEETEPVPKGDPADTGDPADEPLPTDTPEPTDDSDPADEPDPAGDSALLDDPLPSDEPEPMDTPDPTEETEPADEPTPTDTSEPTDEPDPTGESALLDDPLPSDEPTEEPLPEGDPLDEGEPAEEPIVPIQVTFVQQDGTVFSVLEATAGETVGDRFPSDPELFGFSFAGWFTQDNAPFLPDTVLTESLSVYAKYNVYLPAQGFSAKSQNGVTVRAWVDEGVFPADTMIRVRAIGDNRAKALAESAAADGETVTDAVAVDISFLAFDGTVIEPADNGKVHVSVSLDRPLAGERFSVLHQEHDGGLSHVANATASGATFESDSFSIYILVGTSEEAGEDAAVTVTYNFYSQGTLFNTEILRDGQELEDPGTPPLNGNQTFHGWYVDDQKLEFGTVVHVSETATVSVEAKIETTYYVTFYGTTGEIVQVKEAILLTGMTSVDIDTTDVTVIPQLDTQSFLGWSWTPNPGSGAVPVTTVTVTDRNVKLYPIVTNSFWLRFDENDGGPGGGASYTGPVAVEEGHPANEGKPQDPTRPGYTFAGWCTDPEGLNPFDWSQPMTAHVQLYAKWTANANTQYTVILWRQKLTDSKNASDAQKTYDFVESHVLTAETDALITSALYDDYTGFAGSGDYLGFHLGRVDYDEQTVSGGNRIRAKGDTIINVYYDRNLNTIRFHRYTDGSWQIYLVMTGLYGQTLAQNGYEWPSTYDWYANGGSGGSTSGNRTTFLDAFKDESTTVNFYGRTAAGGSYSINHYKQNLDGSYPSTPTNSTPSGGGTFYFSEKYDGFTVSAYSFNQSSWTQTSAGNSTRFNTNLYIRYTRNRYSLSFVDTFGGITEVKKTVGNIPFEQPLTSYLEQAPDLGSHLGYQFDGWYEDSEGTVPFDWSSTMPSANKAIFAKWSKVRFSVHLNPNGGTLIGGQAADFTLEYEEIISRTSLEQNVSRSGWELVGWFDADTGRPYAYGKVTSDVNLIAKWRYPGVVSIVYDAGAHGSEAPEDNGSYSASSTIVIGPPPAQIEEGWMFMGWQVRHADDTTAHYPSETIEIPDESILSVSAHEGRVTLVAVYLEISQTIFATTAISFHPNGGSGSLTTLEPLKINESVPALNGSAAGTRSGYRFIGWSKTPGLANYTESDLFCHAGDSILADNVNTPNILYAAWQKVLTVEIVGNNDTRLYDGVEHSVNGYTAVFTLGDETFSSAPAGVTFALKPGVSATAARTNAGRTEMGLSPDSFTVSANGYIFDGISVTDGYQAINKRQVTLTSATDQKEYDGTPLTNGAVTVTGDGFAPGEGVSYDVTGSQTLVGNSENTFTYTPNGGTHADNYDIVTVFGTLTVTDRTTQFEIEVHSSSDTVLYDGQMHTASGFETLTFTINGQTYTVEGLSASVSEADAGQYPNTIFGSALVRDASGNDVTAQFTVTTVNGTLTVNKRQVTLTSATDRKPYDGTPLTNGAVTVSGDGFAPGEGASYDVTGSQTLVGSSENAFTYALQSGTNLSNYILTTVFGTLTVTDGTDPIDPPIADDLVVQKSAPDNVYKLGDTVTFTITATNIFAEPKTIVLNELPQVTLSESTFPNVAPGASVTATATYTITEADLLLGRFTNTVTAAIGTLTKQASATVSTEQVGGHLTVKKETTSTPANGSTYALNETISYRITVTNDGNVTITNVTVSDPLTNDTWTMPSLGVGESKTFTATYTVTEADLLAGSVKNVATATGTSPDPDHPDVPVTPGEDEQPTESPNGHLTVKKETTSTPANGSAYALNETITYRVTVTNDGNMTITNITVTDPLTNDTWTVPSLGIGESKTFTATYTVTEADLLAGSVKNVATATGTSPDPDHPDVPVTPGEDEQPTESPSGHLTVKKETTSTPANGSTYALNETISYRITVTNDGNVTITNVTVSDPLTNDTWTVPSLGVGESKTFTATYTVTEADLLAGSVKNVATATGTSPDPDHPDVPVTPGEDEQPTESPNGHLTVKKETTSTPANGSTYALNETISYRVTVTNDGNMTITNITVTDPLTNDTWTVPSLGVGESKTFTATYTVTEADLLAGSVKNVATATGTSPDPDHPDVPVTPGEDEQPTESPNGHLTVKKETTSTPANGSAYALNETITYRVTVTNDGNMTITNITVSDPLTNDTWTVPSLGIGESKTFTATYTVTESDLLAGSVKNVATATGTSPDPDHPDVPVTPGEDEQPTESPSGHLTVKKETTSTPANGASYALNETISYRVTVTNDGNVTITNITVTDPLTNDTWTVPSLGIGESKTFTATYTVTEADLLAGSVKNVATATGTSPDPDHPDVPITPGEDEQPTESPSGHLTVKKVTTSTPANGSTYALNETISYRITVTNDGNVTITNITVTDPLTNDTWTVPSLGVGESKTFTATYTVTEADLLAGSVKNVATATGTSSDPDHPDVPVTPGEDEQPTESPSGHLTVKKVTTSTPANGSAYALNETISYRITVTNDGNVTITNVTVTDPLTNDTWTVPSLGVGESRTFTATYTVTEADLLAGSVKNVATATGTSPDPDHPDVPVTPGEDEQPTESPSGHLTVKKETTSTPPNGTAYVLGDVISYRITVTNDGNVTVSGITVTDPLTNDTWTIPTLAIGESRVFTAQYEVMVSDVVATSVVNVANAAGKDPNGHPAAVTPGRTEDRTQKRNDNNIDPTPDPADDDETMSADGKSITVIYDGKSHTVSATGSVSGSTILFSTDGGNTWTTQPPARTDVGTTSFAIKATHPAYEDVIKTGYRLTVLPRPITVAITGRSATKVFNGDEQNVTGYTSSISDPLYTEGDFVLSGEAEAKGTNVGTYPMGLSVSQFRNVNPNFDVTFTVTDGALTITKRPITVTITGNSASLNYNGGEQSVTGYTNSIPDPLYTEGDITFSGAAEAKGTDLGTYPMGLSVSQFANANPNFDVTFRVKDGALTIKRSTVPVEAIAVSTSWLYDGMDHSDPRATVEGLSPYLTYRAIVEGSIRNANETPVKNRIVSFGIYNADGKDVTDHFLNVTLTDGTLSIERRQIILTSETLTKVYDGMPLFDATVTISGDGFLTGHGIEAANAFGLIQNVGSVANTIAFTLLPGMEDVADNYAIILNEGTLNILPRPVTITADDYIKEFEENDPEFTAVVEGLLGDDTVTFTLGRKAGESSGYYPITPNGMLLQGNYRLVFVPGTLQIKLPPKLTTPFTFAWFSDAKIAQKGARTDALEAIANWTAENAEARNIRGLLGTGSLVGTFNDAETEAKAAEILARVREVKTRDLRYYGIAGPIDVNGDARDYTPYLARPMRGASSKYANGEIWFQVFIREELVPLGIGYRKLAETPEEQKAQNSWVRWINQAIESRAGYTFLLLVNDYVDETGALTPFGEMIEREIVAKNPNVRLVLSSCPSGTVHTEKTYGERTVHTLAFNYAADEVNGLGFMRLLTFDPITRNVTLSTYSPLLDRSVYDEATPAQDAFVMHNAY